MKKWLLLVSGLFLLFVIQLLTIEVGAQSPQVLDILNQSKNSNVSSNIEVQSLWTMLRLPNWNLFHLLE